MVDCTVHYVADWKLCGAKAAERKAERLQQLASRAALMRALSRRKFQVWRR